MSKNFFPSNDGLIETLEMYAEDAYVFCAPETTY